ncbi:MAG: metal ABC transporter ATP-binding protein [Acholeplasmatales bacterium]
MTTAYLKDISLTIEKGEYVNIIGPNGSGKTTLIKLFTGALKPTSGTITFYNQTLSYVPQHLHKKKNMPITVYEILKHSNKEKPTDDEIDYYLDLMQISNLKHSKIERLSGGESQRVYIIRALLLKADVLILDEPASALDQDFRHEFYNFIETLHKDGVTIIHVTHDLSDGLRRGSRVIHMDTEVLFDGSFDDFQSHHQDSHHELEGKVYHV